MEYDKEKADILEKTAREYFDSVLFFKSLIALADLYLLQNKGITPSSHNDRFRKLHENFPNIYNLIDKDFPFYQNSYFQIMSKELVEVIKNDAKFMAEKTKIKI